MVCLTQAALRVSAFEVSVRAQFASVGCAACKTQRALGIVLLSQGRRAHSILTCAESGLVRTRGFSKGSWKMLTKKIKIVFAPK